MLAILSCLFALYHHFRVKQDKMAVIGLNTSKLTIAARRMYERLGFKPEIELPRHLGIKTVCVEAGEVFASKITKRWSGQSCDIYEVELLAIACSSILPLAGLCNQDFLIRS